MDHTLGCPSIPPTLHHPTPPCHGNWPIGTCITAAPRDISQVRFREPGYMHPSRQVRISRSHSCRFRSPGPWRFLVASIVPHPHLLLSGFQDMYQGWLLIPERHHLFEHRCLSVSCSVSTPSTISTSAGSTLPRGYCWPVRSPLNQELRKTAKCCLLPPECTASSSHARNATKDRRIWRGWDGVVVATFQHRPSGFCYS
jgi:hypothetical protein